MGRIFDVYLHFAIAGDTYLGRILSGLNPTKATFGTLPPHWIPTNTMKNEHIKEAMELCYGTILDTWATNNKSDPTGILLLFLASIVWHLDWIQTIVVANPNHQFAALPILQKSELMMHLRDLVTLEPTDSMPKATGIPPHVEQAVLMEKLLNTCSDTLRRVGNMGEEIRKAVFDAFEARSLENGQMTETRLTALLDTFQNGIKTQIDGLKAQRMSNTNEGETAPVVMRESEQTVDGIVYAVFAYNGQFYDVPENFDFPLETKRRTAWTNVAPRASQL